MNGSALVDHIQIAANFEPRVGFDAPALIVLHYTGMESGRAAVDWLCNPISKVSCHYLVDVDGTIYQMVDEGLRAWHAGQSSWQGVYDINSMSIGIEIQNPGHVAGCPAFPQQQMDRVISLCLDIMARHGLAPEQVVAHSDIAPGRKIDPGEAFDWLALARAGIGLHVLHSKAACPDPVYREGENCEDIADSQRALSSLGYGLDTNGRFDKKTRIVIEAFQRRYRPSQVSGVIDGQTLDIINRLRAVQPSSGYIA